MTLDVSVIFTIAVALLSSVASAAVAWTIARRRGLANEKRSRDNRKRLQALEHWRSREEGAAKAVARQNTAPFSVVESGDD